MLEKSEKKKIWGFYRTMREPDFFVKIEVSDGLERNFFSLTVFSQESLCTILAGDIDSSVMMDRHVQLESK